MTTEERRRTLASWFRGQAAFCESVGSGLYALLLERGAADVEGGGPTWPLVAEAEPIEQGWMICVSLMAAVHRLVLAGRLPGLARFYPSAGGTPGEAAWAEFRAALAAHHDEIRALMRSPIQTNEVGRSAALLGGFLLAAYRFGLPLRLLEIGAAAGLNLRWDRYRYEWDGGAWGDPASPVRFAPAFEGGAPPAHDFVAVAERAGCDRAPIDPLTEDGRLTLLSFVWADQVERVERLRGALTVARTVPVSVERADAAEWLERRLASPPNELTTVVYHSVVLQYLDDAARARMRAILEEAGRAATQESPLVWLRLEPPDVAAAARFDVTLTAWPGGDEQVIATAPPHGLPATWIG
jgi:hypothetical protein